MAKILFLQDNAINESLALTELSAYLKINRHKTDLLIEKEETDLYRSIREIAPDIIVIPFSLGAERWFFSFYEKLQKHFSDTTIIVGGTAPSFYPELVQEEHGINIILRGEAELAMLEFIEKFEAGEDVTSVDNFSFNLNGKIIHNPIRPAIKDLSIIPMPDREIYYKYKFIKDFSWKKFSTGRGCVNNCSYCYNQSFKNIYEKSRFVRRKTPEQVVKEVKHIFDNYHISIAHFSDDLFTADKLWLKKFSRLYRKELDLPFSINTCADKIDYDIVRMLKEAGISMIAMGVETGNEELRKKILNKNLSNELIKNRAKIIKDAGITLVTFNMLGFPGETIHDALSTLKFNKEIGADYIRMGFAQPLSKTEMTSYATQNGYLDINWNRKNTYEKKIFQLSQPIFRVDDLKKFIGVYYASKLYDYFSFDTLVKFVDKVPLNPFFKLFELLTANNEKKIFRLELINGFRYFYHVGPPNNRTTNYVSII